jgi:branched-chain amino acid transport system substrate-binding protein
MAIIHGINAQTLIQWLASFSLIFYLMFSPSTFAATDLPNQAPITPEAGTLTTTNHSDSYDEVLAIKMNDAELSQHVKKSTGNENYLEIWIDADFSHNRNSAQAIQAGIITALSNVNYQVGGRAIKIIGADHRGNPIRSKRTMKSYMKSDKAIAILGGLHSGPYIKNREFINSNEILLLAPWSAAGMITRYPSIINWVFRVSVDDSKAGQFLSEQAFNKKCKTVDLVLENTGWGRGNQKNIKKSQLSKYTTHFFDWGVGGKELDDLVEGIMYNDADCMIFVGNANEGASIFGELVKYNYQKPIISHWGITSGNLREKLGKFKLSSLDVEFIQTCFSFMDKSNSEHNVLDKAINVVPMYSEAKDIVSPVGFIHSYDIGLLLIEALSQVNPDSAITEQRRQLRHALENLNSPIPGLVKTYQNPFSVWAETNPDAHEALDQNNLCMARYDDNSSIVLVSE